MKKVIFYISFLFLNFIPHENHEIYAQENKDSVLILIKKARNLHLNRQKRKDYLSKAFKYSDLLENDSIKNQFFLKIAYTYNQLGDSINFRIVNKRSIIKSTELNDSLSLSYNYWDLGGFYEKLGIKDSAYYVYSKAQKIYEGIGHDFYSGTILLNMAVIQSDIKDYTGSENTTIKAISLLKPLKKYRHLYRCYNNLGVNFSNLGEYDNAIYYYNQALKYVPKIDVKNSFAAATLNNIGIVYENKGDYNGSIAYYIKALKDNELKKNNIRLYTKLIDNLAYSRFKLGDVGSVEESFKESLRLRDSIKDHLGIAINKLHLAEFYAYKKDTLTAIQFSNEAEQIAQKTHNNRDLLASFLLLSKLDKENRTVHYNRYISLNDSLQKHERATRDKFTRIQYETDEVISKNERLNRQKELILTLAGIAALFSILLFIIITQRAKNKAMKLEQQQQVANEEIYNLLLSQQSKLEEGSKLEKKRISEELHDGVLGKLFGTRLLLGNLNHKTDEATTLQREKYINELQEIEEEVRNISHELNNDALIKDIGYTNLVERLLEDQSQIGRFEYKITNDKRVEWESITGSLKMNLYRILQEAIQNINKYAKAKDVLVEFKLKNSQLHLHISDNGIGFDPQAKRNGIGLNNIKSRVGKLNGKLAIKSNLDKGTSIEIEVPI